MFGYMRATAEKFLPKVLLEEQVTRGAFYVDIILYSGIGKLNGMVGNTSMS